jgi:hypothetical protein
MTSIIQVSDQINQAMIKFNYSDISHIQLAKMVGFDADELKKLELLWESAYNDSMIYLSNDIILNQMTNSKGKDTITNFITRKLLGCSDYIKNVDYQEVNQNHKLVQYYKNCPSSNLTRVKKNNRGTNFKKYYIVTGETYEDLLMKSTSKSGKQSRKFYRKTINLAKIMRDYIVATYQYNINKQLKEQTAQLNHANTINKELLTFKLMKEKNESVYVMSTRAYAQQGLFKIGRTKQKISKRLSGANTSHPIGSDMRVLKEIKTHNATALERRCHWILQNLRPSDKREFFLCQWDTLIILLDLISENMDKEIDEVNTLVQEIYTTPNNNLEGALDMSIFDHNTPLLITNNIAPIDITTLSTEDKRSLCILILEEYIQETKNMPNYKFETDKDKLYNNLPLEIRWSNIKEFFREKNNLNKTFKKTEWRNLFRNISNSVLGVNYKTR